MMKNSLVTVLNLGQPEILYCQILALKRQLDLYYNYMHEISYKPHSIMLINTLSKCNSRPPILTQIAR